MVLEGSSSRGAADIPSPWPFPPRGEGTGSRKGSHLRHSTDCCDIAIAGMVSDSWFVTLTRITETGGRMYGSLTKTAIGRVHATSQHSYRCVALSRGVSGCEF